MVKVLTEKSSLSILDNAGDKFWDESKDMKEMPVYDPGTVQIISLSFANHQIKCTVK